MKRAIIILTLALASCVGACLMVYFHQMRTPSEEWMGRRLGLRDERLAEFTEAHNRYAATCAEMCVKIQQADAHLAALILSSTALTPEIRKAMAASDALRSECREGILRHAYEVSAMLGPRERATYLNLVLPLIVQPDLMSQAHHHP